MTKPITSVGVAGTSAPSLEELMERATERRGPERLESRSAVGPTVDRALLAFDRSQALASSVRLFALRQTPGASEPLPEGDPIEERPIAPLGTEESTGTGGSGTPAVREGTIEVGGRRFPVVITRGEADAPEGYVSIATREGQTLWAASDVAGDLRTALDRTDGGYAIVN